MNSMSRFVLVALVVVCSSAVSFAIASAEYRAPKGWTAFGQTPSLTSARPLSKTPAQSPGSDLEVFVQGTITEVCQAKGCWMNVASAGQSVRVEFKDYGFFVPSDAKGRKVKMQGILEERTLSEAEREHIAAESESGATVPERVRVFVASGVLIQGKAEIPDTQRARIGGQKTESAPAEE